MTESLLLTSALGNGRARGPAWLDELRARARARLSARGLPTPKHEAWKFTSIAPIANTSFQEAELRTIDLGAATFPLAPTEGVRLFVVDGYPVFDLRSAPEGLEVHSLRDEAVHGLVTEHLGRIAEEEHFVALNGVSFSDGLVIRARAGTRSSLEVVYVATAQERDTAGYPRTMVAVEPRAELELVETYVAEPGSNRRLTNSVTEVSVGQEGKLVHLRVLEGSSTSYHVGAVAVSLARNARYESHVTTLGGPLSRLDLRARLMDVGAECSLDGVYVASNGEHVDHNTVIDHASPDGSSREYYAGVVLGSGHAVFDGTVLVARDAVRTAAHQQNRNLLLSDEGVVHTKPHLEIDADDVRCSHGATVGSLDPQQLFYLRARGIDEEAARSALTFAFLRSVVDRVPNERYRAHLARRILAILPHGELAAELS